MNWLTLAISLLSVILSVCSRLFLSLTQNIMIYNHVAEHFHAPASERKNQAGYSLLWLSSTSIKIKITL
jgi:hypothetical protein